MLFSYRVMLLTVLRVKIGRWSPPPVPLISIRLHHQKCIYFRICFQGPKNQNSCVQGLEKQETTTSKFIKNDCNTFCAKTSMWKSQALKFRFKNRQKYDLETRPKQIQSNPKIKRNPVNYTISNPSCCSHGPPERSWGGKMVRQDAPVVPKWSPRISKWRHRPPKWQPREVKRGRQRRA